MSQKLKKSVGISPLQLEMIEEANLIWASIDFIENSINAKVVNFEKHLFDNDFKEASDLEKEIHILLKKLSLEEENMDKFMSKYRNKINEEKTKILHDIK